MKKGTIQIGKTGLFLNVLQYSSNEGNANKILALLKSSGYANLALLLVAEKDKAFLIL